MNQEYKSKKIEAQPEFEDFQKISQILEIIKSWTTNETQTVWAGYDNGKEFLADLNADIEKIKCCDFTTLNKLNMEFKPTSTYQEIAMSNTWADEYLKLAEQFDRLYEKIKKQHKTTAYNKSQSNLSAI